MDLPQAAAVFAEWLRQPAFVAAVVSIIVSGSIGLYGLHRQDLRSKQEARVRLVLARIDETRRNQFETIQWLWVAKGQAGREAAGPYPSASSTPRQNMALIGDAPLIARLIDALSWLAHVPDGTGLDSQTQGMLASLVGDVGRALDEQELRTIEGKPLRTVSEAERLSLDQRAGVVVGMLEEIQAAQTSPDILNLDPPDDAAFGKTVREAIDADTGPIDGAAGRVGKRVSAQYPKVGLELTGKPGVRPRRWSVWRDGKPGSKST